MIYGLKADRDQWLIVQMESIISKSPDVIDGLSIELKGVDPRSFKLIIELHGKVTAEQLRMLADAIENTPNATEQGSE